MSSQIEKDVVRRRSDRNNLFPLSKQTSPLHRATTIHKALTLAKKKRERKKEADKSPEWNFKVNGSCLQSL